MCHGDPSPSFPAPAVDGEVTAEGVEALAFGAEAAPKRIAVIPDIYGLNQFYRGLCTHLAAKGSRVLLVNPFAGLGELPEATREAAFARRMKVRDKAFVDRFEAFCNAQQVHGILGFCLGGFYVFELARRNVAQDLVGFYGFPQGMRNEDPLPVPFDYLGSIDKPHTCLMPGQDQSVGVENVARLGELAEANPNLRLKVYPESGHGFLNDLDGDDPKLKSNAAGALATCESALGL